MEVTRILKNKKFEQKDENESIFAVSFPIGDHTYKKMPVKYEIMCCVVTGNIFMLFYQCDVDVEFENCEFYVTGNELQRKKIKQCSMFVLCEVTTLISQNKYQLNKINSSLNYQL